MLTSSISPPDKTYDAVRPPSEPRRRRESWWQSVTKFRTRDQNYRRGLGLWCVVWVSKIGLGFGLRLEGTVSFNVTVSNKKSFFPCKSGIRDAHLKYTFCRRNKLQSTSKPLTKFRNCSWRKVYCVWCLLSQVTWDENTLL